MTFNDRNQDKSRAEAPLKHQWGTRFKTAREAMHLTEKDAAARLHLKPHLIAIIESERFENGPPPIFMRGYIRSYARMLNIPEKEITQALAQLNLENPATSTPTPVVRTRIHSQNNSNTGWSTALVVLVLVGLVGMWWNSHSRNSLKDRIATSSQSVAPVANNTAQIIDNSNLPQAPMDPTPKELLNSSTVASTKPGSQAPAGPLIPFAASRPSVTTTDGGANPVSGDKQAATVAEADVKPTKKTHIAKARDIDSDMASDEMAVPEQGLDSEDNNN